MSEARQHTTHTQKKNYREGTQGCSSTGDS